jgi:hypothetical protein
MVYALPAGPVAREPSTQLKREGVGDGSRDRLGVAPVVAVPDPVGSVPLEASVTNMTEIKFEPPGRALCPSFLK